MSTSTLPNVSIIFADGQLGIQPASVDGVFLVVGASSRGVPGRVYAVTSSNSIIPRIGLGPGPESVGQIFGSTSTLTYLVPGARTAGTVGAVSQSRSDGPIVTILSLLGLPGSSFAPSVNNTSTSYVNFDATSTPIPSDLGTFASVSVTTGGVLGTAQATIVLGDETYHNVVLPLTSWTDPGGSGVVLDFVTTPGGRFEAGDAFTANSSPTDGYNILVQINSVNEQGYAAWNYSLDGGVTFSASRTDPFGCFVKAVGTTPPDLAISGTAPDASTKVVFAITQQGTATGPAAQVGTNSGYLYNSTSPSAAHGVVHITTPGSGLTYPVTVAITGTGTAVGAGTTALPATGTGTAAGSVTINGATVTFAANHFPATFTDSATGVVVTFVSTTNNLTSGDNYTNAGVLTNDNGGGTNTAAVAAISTATTGSVVVTAELAVTTTGIAFGTGTGSATSSPATSGSATAGGTLTVTPAGSAARVYTFVGSTNGIPVTFTDSPSGLVFKMSCTGATTALELVIGDTYRATCQPAATYTATVTIDGTANPTTGLSIPANGIVSIPGVSGPALTFAHLSTDLYTYSSTIPSSTNQYTFYVYPSVTFEPTSRGASDGLQFAFGFGTYLAADQYLCQCTAPAVSQSDAIDALEAALASGISFSMAHFACTPTSFAAAGTLATAVNTVLETAALSPSWTFLRGLVYGPDKTSTTAGSAPSDFIAATSALALTRTSMSCGADRITSVLTLRQDLRNPGRAYTARLATISLQIDPGYVGGGALANVVSTTTSADDATIFFLNRGLVSRIFNKKPGVFCAGGVTLAAPGSDYGLISYCRVVDKAAAAGRVALLQYVNSSVPTVPGAGTIDPTYGNSINNNVRGQILIALNGAAQDVAVNVSLTQDIIATRSLPVIIGVRVFGILQYIEVTIGLAF